MALIKQCKKLFQRQPKEPTFERIRPEATDGDGGRCTWAGMQQLRLSENSGKLAKNGDVTIVVNGLTLGPGDCIGLVIGMGNDTDQDIHGDLQVKASSALESVFQAVQGMTIEELNLLNVVMRHLAGTSCSPRFDQ